MDVFFGLLALISLIGSSLLSLYRGTFLQVGSEQGRILRVFFPHPEMDSIQLSLTLSKSVYQLLYLGAALLFYIQERPEAPWFLTLGAPILLFLFIDTFAQLGMATRTKRISPFLSPIATLFLIPVFPWIAILVKGCNFCLSKLPISKEPHKAKLQEILLDSRIGFHLDPHDRKLMASFINFKERVAKEIMVPRVDLFSLSSDTTLQEAANIVSKEGYSRIPIYKDTLDQIVGVVLYKDLLKCYASKTLQLSDCIETIAKPVLYTPENKKVSQLLQEFRTKQIHMAIVVDEYGGTEGIVTIEDILEELVGEIEDEYDVDEENPFWEIPGGGWIIDAKMTLFDIAAQIGVHIPTHPEYETLGGYVYHCAGTIPNKGWRLSHDQFDLEVVSSNERAINKIKIVPRKTP
jgi:CBS domain containing-hemolysin-like protein